MEKIIKNGYLKLDIQKFAEDDTNGEDTNNSSTGGNEPAKADDGGAVEKTLTELLNENPTLQSEFDKLNAKSIETARTNWQKEAEVKKTEAEKLAKMDAEEKHKYELEKERKEKEDAKTELNAYRLEKEATKMATEKGLDITLLETIDFTKETADSVKEKLEKLETSFSKAVEKAINDKLKQNSPKNVQENAKPNLSGFEKFLEENK